MSTCFACDARVVWRHNGLWCERCRLKVETCCEGAPQAGPASGPVLPLRTFPSPSANGRGPALPGACHADETTMFRTPGRPSLLAAPTASAE
jgi:hypothetical protein